MRLRILIMLLPAAAAGCAETTAPPPVVSAPSAAVAPAATATPAVPGPPAATFLPYTPGATAITYDPKVVPAGAIARVAVGRAGDGVTVRLSVTGMVPRRAYGAHLHVRPCTAAPDAAGPHYQHRADPETPSVDPSYANPANEVWLDFTADAQGAATVTAEQDWSFDGRTPPRSLVVHAEPTRTAPGVAGTAGPRVACLTLPG